MDAFTEQAAVGSGGAVAWLKALRLKFYPMSWLTYALGAVAIGGAGALSTGVFWAGFVFIFFLEATTVLSNEYFDFPTDRLNACAGPFSGGSRVLVSGELSFAQLRRGIVVCGGLSLLAALAVLAVAPDEGVAAALMIVLAMLALGYTAPPLRLSYRTLGELDVALTDSIGVLLLGHVLLGGDWRDPMPWLLSLPLGLAFLPSITLCAVPDFGADRQAGKRTLAVRLGIPAAAAVAGASALLAALGALALPALGLLPPLYGPLAWLGLLHAMVLAVLLLRELRNVRTERRIDGLIALSLAFVPWYGVLPLIHLLKEGS